MKSVTKAILSCDCVTFDTLLFCMTCLRIVGIMFHSVHKTHVICKYVQRRRQIEGSSKYQSNRMGKDVCYLVYLCFQIPKRVQSKAVLFPLGYYVFLRPICVHASRARVWDISISLYSMLIALFLFVVFQFLRDFKCNKYIKIDRRLEVSLILTMRRDQTKQNAQISALQYLRNGHKNC